MTKLFISIILILICLTSSFGQELGDSCEEAIARANKDFSKGIMKATSYGLNIAADSEFEDFYDKYLLNKYNVIAAEGGCVVSDGRECYSSRMYALIKQKYGKDFFEKSRVEAEKLYPKKRKTFDDEENEDSLQAEGVGIDNSPYVLVDVQPEFPGGLERLYKYVDKEMNRRKISFDSVGSRLYVQFVIDSTGRTKGVDVIKGSDPKVDSALVGIFRKMPKWTPGLKQNKKVNTKLIIPFSY